MKGCIHIYCGDGKGKTSAAIGLAVRAAGRGKRIYLSRFLKTDDSGEVSVLQHYPPITVRPCDRTFGFISRLPQEEKREASDYYTSFFRQTCQAAICGDYDVLIMDEIIGACNFGMVPEGEVLDFLKSKPETMEIVLTGRDPSDEFISLADYVSEVKKIKHPYEKGIGARKGIEY